MGWKNIQDKFRIKHTVQIRDNRICIGSGYIGEIISISFDGKIIKRNEVNANDDLKRYQFELDMAEKTGELKKLINDPDAFSNLKAIYTHEKGVVIKKMCEEYGYPNVCTDGDLMYDNTFFKDRKKAVKDCHHDSKLGVKFSAQNFGRKFVELNKDMWKSTNRLLIDIYELIRSYFN